LKEFLAQLTLEPLAPEGAIDSGAEEELFRRLGREAAKEALRLRWQAADEVRESPCCGSCGQALKALGAKPKRLRTLCGSLTMQRRVYYCEPCQQTEAPLDQRLGVVESGITPGLMRVICRSALELAYEQSQSLLHDTLGFSPCSAREVERIAKKHGARIERLAAGQSVAVVSQRKKRPKPRFITAIDAAMIPGLPDPETHCLAWHDVKVAVVFDARKLVSTSYVAGREQVTGFSDRFWQHLQSRALDERDFCLALGDGADWIGNLVEMHLPGVPQLLDFYHAAEHLYATAKSVWPEQTAGNWWHRRLQQLKEGQLQNFFAALKWLARSHAATFEG
jgi:hypothetical protein